VTGADQRSRGAASAEAVILALVGAELAGLVGRLVLPASLDPVAAAMMVIGGLNGLVSGWRGTYRWRRADGWLAFVLDTTWASLPVGLGLVAHAGAAVQRDAGHVPWLGHRQNRHVYRRGIALKPGFAFTIGNVISGAGNVDSPRRRRLITDHEDVHVWQSRWFGPLYPVLYVVWAGSAAAAGVVLWLVRGRRQPFAKVVESYAYYANPFEWWAYSRDDLWPPPGKLAGIGWRRAATKPLAMVGRRLRRPPDAEVPPPAARH
jgi:hypothetical protein